MEVTAYWIILGTVALLLGFVFREFGHRREDKVKFEREKENLLRTIEQNERLARIGLLAGHIAHDLQGELTVPFAYSELIPVHIKRIRQILDSFSNPENIGRAALNDVNQAFQKVEDASRRIGDNLAQLPEQMRILKNECRDGVIEYEILPMKLRDLILTMAMFTRLFAHESKIKVELTTPPPDLQDIFVTGSYLLQSGLINACRNSIMALAEQPNAEIDISLYYQSNKVALGLKDNGSGMTESELSAVCAKLDDPGHWNKPFSGNRFTSRSRNGIIGTGFGLLTLGRALKLCGGFARIDSAENRGTNLKIELVLAEDPSIETEKMAAGKERN